mgnify:FL=1
MNAPAPFSQLLRAECQEDWQAAIQHRFVDEIFAGTLASEHLRHYLVQDYQFIDRFVALLGAAIASADQYAARVRFSQFAAMITSDENTYFQRCFDLLRVPTIERTTPTLDNVTLQFQDLMREAAETRRYASALAVLCVAEGLYLEWADQPGRALPPEFQHAEWITLHANDFFRDFVAWLRSELDRVGATIPVEQQDEARRFFHRAVALERAFFDSVYTGR